MRPKAAQLLLQFSPLASYLFNYQIFIEHALRFMSSPKIPRTALLARGSECVTNFAICLKLQQQLLTTTRKTGLISHTFHVMAKPAITQPQPQPFAQRLGKPTASCFKISNRGAFAQASHRFPIDWRTLR